ncbi:protein kinase [Geothrix sp. PMB-07]|uniref:protein kinase domain-containing protein n=1 Tax=Geothrix sp. PMB-07 TaxID=3068640 RepID=UPI002741E19F|nr:protein kinase [Geothrix sp. PMB-07]WLT30548.1 protein kinase [Geothrix sp. PMB-07]
MSNDPQPASALPSERRLLEPGDQVGRFQVEWMLGSGGMGEVYRAWDPTLERSVALKALRTSEEREHGAPERFRREALALAQLNHPNVCQVHDWVNGPGGTFIAMELLEGQTLDLVAPELKLQDKLQVIRSVALALEAAHAKGLVHRDLKPSNIMVALGKGEHQTPLVKVLDFGLARLMDPHAPGETQITPSPVPNLALLQALEEAERKQEAEQGEATLRRAEGDRRTPSGPHSWEQLTLAGTFMGSPSYASPEQIQGQAAGPSSDVFSLGIVAWELLAGEHPFPGEGKARMRAIIEGSRRELKVRGLPSGAADLLRAMLDAHPFKRPTAARVAQALGHLLRPRSVLRWTAIAVATAALLAVGANWFMGRGIIADLVRQRPARLAVLPFQNLTGDPTLDPILRHLLPEMLEAGLREHPKLAPLDLESVVRAQNTLHLSEGSLSTIDLKRLASALGAPLLLRGGLRTDADGTYLLDYELLDASGAIRQSGRAQLGGKLTAGPASIPLARKVVGDLFKAVDPFAASHARNPVPELPAKALEAYIRGAALIDKGDFKEAVPAFKEATRLAPDYPAAVLWYARGLSRVSDTPPEPVFQWARWAARAQGNRVMEMKALHELAVRYSDTGQWEASDQTCQEVLALARSMGQLDYEAGAHTTLGVTLQRQHKAAEAESAYQQSLALYQAVGDKLSATRVLNNLGVIEKERGNLKGAEARYTGALETVKSYGDRWGEAILTNNLGDLALAQEGGLDRAESFFRRAQSLREALGDQNGLVYSLMGLASVSQARGDLDRAEGLVRQFLELARKTDLRPMEALAVYNLGELNRTAGRYEAARGFYRESLALHEVLKDAVMEAHCLAGEAECLARDGHRGMAKALLERSRILSTEETPYILRSLACLARAEGRADEAKVLFAKALTGARSQAPEIVRELKDLSR